MSEEGARTRGKGLPRLNFRPFLVAAMGLLCGCFAYGAIAFGTGTAAEAAVFVIALALLLPPFGVRRVACVLGIFAFFALAGTGLTHWSAVRFESGPPAGEYAVTGTVELASVRGGYTSARLTGLTFDGAGQGGKMEVTLSGEDVRVGDVLAFTASVSRNALPADGDGYAAADFANGVRYVSSPVQYVRTGRSHNFFLVLNGALYDTLHRNMEKDEADIAYALLTGDMRVMDGDFAEATRTGGIAHVFAVSGLHISVLYAAVMLLLRRPLGRWATIPAVLLGVGYCAMCAFTVSSVRSLLMCAFAGGMRFFGKKYDDLSSLSLAAVLTLLVSPAQYFSVSFRLSYGAMAGIFLFSEPLSRGMRRWKVPAWLAENLVSGVSAQIFTFPVMVGTFGYLSVWGTLLNLIVIPALPLLFLPLVACAFLFLIMPFAAGVLLALPQGLLSATLFAFSVADVSAVLAGFSLGAGAGVWMALNVPLCARVRLRPLARGAACGAVAMLFVACVLLENALFAGCRIDISGTDRGTCALVRTQGEAVLLIDGDASLSACTDFLRRTYGGELDAVMVLSEDAVRAVNVAAFLPVRRICAAYPVETGLQEREVEFGTAFSFGGLRFYFEDADRLTLIAQGCVTEFCFEGDGVLHTDLFVGGGGGRLKYLLKDGIIRTL